MLGSDVRRFLDDRQALLCAAVAAASAAVLYLWSGDVGLNLADEGFLWYGVERTLAGELPLRDFQSYDPGRYFWCAAWSFVFGHGIMAVRAAAAVFQGAGIFLGLLAARRVVRSRVLLCLLAPALALWMFPYFKFFEPSLALAAVYVGVVLIERPSLRRHFSAGLFVGFAACFGRNHAFYNAAAFLILIFVLAKKNSDADVFRKFGAWVLGGVLGFSPLLVLLLFAPGFAASYFDFVLHVLRQGTNLERPYPWPWSFPYRNLFVHEQIAVAVAFWLPLVLYPIGLIIVLRSAAEDLRRRALFVASIVIGSIYIHHVSTRSDAQHLAQCIPPLFLAWLALPTVHAVLRRRVAAAVLWVIFVGMTAFATPALNPMLIFHRPGGARWEFVPFAAGGDTLRIEKTTADYLNRLRSVLERHVGAEQSMLIVPHVTTLYPLFDKVSPTWGNYLLWPAEPAAEERMIHDLEEKGVKWVLLIDLLMEPKRELLFRNSHPRVMKYVQEHFTLVQDPELPRAHTLWGRKAAETRGRSNGLVEKEGFGARCAGEQDRCYKEVRPPTSNL